MIDLKLIFNTSYAAVTRSVSSRGVGGFLGATTGAFLVDKYENHLDLSIGISTTFASVFLSAIPFVPSIDHAWFLFFATGGLGGLINVAGIRFVLKMWKERSPPLLSALHMGYGIGALVGPMLCSPFLASLSSVPGTNRLENQGYYVIKESRVHQAYLCIGLFTLIVSLPFYVFQYRLSRMIKFNEVERGLMLEKKTRTYKELLNPGTYANGNFKFGLCMLIILFIYYFNLVGGQLSMATFIRTISVDFYHFGKGRAALLNTGFWFSLTIGRFISAVLSHYIPVKTLLLIQVFLHLCSATLLYYEGISGSSIFTILLLIESLLIAPLYPQGIAYGNTQIEITGLGLMVIAFAGSFGDMVYVWTVGWLYDNQGPQSVFSLSTFSAIVLFVCVVLFRIVTVGLKESWPSTISK